MWFPVNIVRINLLFRRGRNTASFIVTSSYRSSSGHVNLQKRGIIHLHSDVNIAVKDSFNGHACKGWLFRKVRLGKGNRDEDFATCSTLGATRQTLHLVTVVGIELHLVKAVGREIIQNHLRMHTCKKRCLWLTLGPKIFLSRVRHLQDNTGGFSGYNNIFDFLRKR